jgi:hypothetical protein
MPAVIDLMTKNPAQGYGATISAAMDFSDYDRVDEDALNRILWRRHQRREHAVPSAGASRAADAVRHAPLPEGDRLTLTSTAAA